jgi:hypothetical protein
MNTTNDQKSNGIHAVPCISVDHRGNITGTVAITRAAVPAATPHPAPVKPAFKTRWTTVTGGNGRFRRKGGTRYGYPD